MCVCECECVCVCERERERYLASGYSTNMFCMYGLLILILRLFPAKGAKTTQRETKETV